MTIHPLTVPGHPSREEAAANTEFPNRKLPAPLTNEQLADLRTKAQALPQHNTQSADNAKRIAERAARRAASQK